MLFIILLLLVLVGGALTLVMLENLLTQVHVVLWSWQMPSVSVGLLIFGAFLLGALLLYVISALSAWSDRRVLGRLQRRVAELERQLAGSMVPAMSEAGTSQPPSSSVPNMPTMPIPRLPDSQQY